MNEFIHTKALQQEITAALAEKADTIRVMLHYDNTSHCQIDGEWPSIILNFPDDDKENCLCTIYVHYFSHTMIVNRSQN